MATNYTDTQKLHLIRELCEFMDQYARTKVWAEGGSVSTLQTACMQVVLDIIPAIIKDEKCSISRRHKLEQILRRYGKVYKPGLYDVLKNFSGWL